MGYNFLKPVKVQGLEWYMNYCPSVGAGMQFDKNGTMHVGILQVMEQKKQGTIMSNLGTWKNPLVNQILFTPQSLFRHHTPTWI